MKLNKKLFGRSLYKIATILFLVGYNFAPAAFAIGDIPKLEVKQDQSVSVTTEETSEVTEKKQSDTSGDIIEGGGASTSIYTEKKVLPSRTNESQKAVLSNTGQYTISSTSGIWTSVSGGSNITGRNTKEIRWGTPVGDHKSGLRFDGAGTQSFNPGQKFLIGGLTHFNWPTYAGTAANGATLKITLNFTEPEIPVEDTTTFSYDFKINETPNKPAIPWMEYESNRYKYCIGYPIGEQLSKIPCDDVITFPNSYTPKVIIIDDIKYTLVVDGFQDDYPTGSPVSKFITTEEKDNLAYLVGHLSSVLVEKPAISIEKYVGTPNLEGEYIYHDADEAPGIFIGEDNPVVFKYVVQNTGNVGLTNITVTDDKGVEVSCPEAVLEPGASMTCTSTGTHTATLGLYTNIGTVDGTHSTGTVTANDPANYTGLKKIKICHATSNDKDPYNNANASMDGDVQGHDSHHGNNPPRIWYPNIEGSWDDIIPPFNYNGVNYPGKNWNEYGQSVYNNDCTAPTGTLKVKKITLPSTDTTSFDITGIGTPAASGAPTFHNGNTGTISHGNPHTYTVSPGTYSVSETVPTGWKEVSNTCNNIVIAKGETKECTITNTKYGSITIIKDARPSSRQEFQFTLTAEGIREEFKLIDNLDNSNPSKVIENVVAGTYSVTENNAPGWDLTSATCTDGSPVTAIDLSAGENVTCTFVNEKRGSISGHKYYDEDGKADTTNDRHPVQGWTIFIDANNNGVLDEGEASKITGADGKYTFSNIKPGTYTIIEVMQSGWINLTGKTQTITIVAGENRENVDFVNIEYPTIQVIKKVDTNGDGTVDQENATDWEWKLDTATYQTGIAPVENMPGTYTVSETQKPNYHVTSLVCKNGETEIVNTVSESVDITLKSGDKVVCTFTNARNLGQLIVKKVVVNDNGGTLEAKDFSFKVDSADAVSFTPVEGNALLGENKFTKYAGLSYNIVEVEADQRGYTTSYENCSNVTVPHNGTATCIITNNDNKPSLKLVKEVVNDNGGDKVAKDWTLTATGPVTVTGDGVATSGDDFEAGTYTLSETGKTGVDVSGYKAGNWSCTNDIAVNENNQITVPLGKSTVCTIVNDDIAPSLELVKVVRNDFGGNAIKTDWNLKAEGVSSINGDGGVKSGTDFKAGTYTLSEAGVEGKDVSGYSASDWSCTDGITVDNNVINIGIGESTVCTITNTEIQPTLTLVKTVDNSNGGTKEASDFKLYIGDNQVTSGVANGVNSRVEYTVREDQLDGYTASVWGGDCSSDGKITLKSGDNKTCTITNTAIAPTLKLVKNVINDNGGTLTAADWTLTATGDSGFSDTGNSTTFHTVKAGVGYVLSESEKSGYLPGDWSCDGGTLSSNTITLDLAENVTCTITNNDVAPKLTLNKIVSNTHGGNKAESAWTLKATSGTEVLSGSGAEGDADVVSGSTFQAGTYTLSEEGPSGYDASAWTCTGTGTQNGSTITLGIGQEAVCSITNSDRASGLTVKKHVKNDNGGTATVADFGITLTDTTLEFDGGVTSGTTTTYTSNPTVVSNKTYTVAEGDHPGYVEGGWSCIDNNNPSTEISNTFTLSEGQSITCEVTNDDIAPGLTIKKHVKNDNGGTATVADFGITLTDTALTFDGGVASGTTTTYTSNPTVVANKAYTVTEGEHSGYDEGTWSCTDNSDSSSVSIPFTLSEGQNVTCEVTNDDIQPQLTVIKVVDNKEYGDKEVSDFNLYVSGTSVTSGESNGFNVGDYTVSEDNLDGYTAVITGDCDANGNVTLNVGDNKTCTITNTSTHGKIIIKKLVEPNTNGTEFEFTGDVAGKIGHNGEISKIVLPGSSYSVSETVPTGWSLKALTCDDTDSTRNENTANINVSDNETVTCTFTNKVIDPILEIEKSNNKTGIDQYAGNEVIYTIKVTAPKDKSEGTYVLNDVVVSDIAPAGFKYISGTWTAKKNGVDMVIPEPTYNGTDRAQWILGQMVEEDKIVLTYKTQISLGTDPGVYPDIAWVKGVSLSGTNVLGNVSTEADTPFVGTDVKVIEDDIVEKGEVLGASISLPNTGANTYLTLGALIMMIIGAISLLFKPFKKFKYALLSALMAISFVTLITPNTVLAADSDIQVKIMKPETPTNKKSFNVGFVVLDLNNNPVTVECFKDAEVVPFETHTHANAGNCAVTIAASGTYTFYVKATSASGTKKTAPVTVEINLDKPSPVIDYSKAGNVLKFKTANDGKTVKVEIHRSEKPSYTASESTKIHEMVVAPNTEYSWTDTSAKPGKTYYYALRSLDAFGNVSTMVSDPEVKVTQEATTTTPSATGTAVAGTETKTEGEVKGDTDEEIMEIKEVKEGKEKVQDGKDGKEGEEKEVELTPSYKKYWYIWVPAILLVLGVGYMYVKRSKEE